MLNFNLKWTFSITEIVGVVAMAAGFAAFLKILVGPAAAGLGLLLLAFAILPNQGIYAFIPGTFSLSLSMLLWAYLLKAKSEAKILPVLLATIIILGIHQISKIYILAAIVIHAIGLGRFSAIFQRRNLLLYGSVGVTVLIAFILSKFLPILAQPSLESFGSAAFGGGVVENLKSSLSLIIDPFVRKNLLLVSLFLIGLIFYRKKSLTPKLGLILALISGLLLISMIHILNGYPAELFSRLFVPFAVVAAGVAGKFVLLQVKSGKYKKIHFDHLWCRPCHLSSFVGR